MTYVVINNMSLVLRIAGAFFNRLNNVGVSSSMGKWHTFGSKIHFKKIY